VKDLLRYQGGKSKIADWIISTFPKHICYVEVFGGGASVLLAKERSKVEVFNDLYEDIVVFFRVLRDKPDELKKYLTYLPFSRVEHERFQKALLAGKIESDIERAVAVFFLTCSSFSGQISSSFSPAKARGHARDYSKKVGNLELFADRFRGVVIENLDFKDCIKKYDSPETLFYCDPPYLERKSEYYRPRFDYRDHYELAKVLKKIEGFAVVSHFESEEIRGLYPEWIILEKVVNINTTFWKGLEKRPKMTELLLLNFKPKQPSRKKKLSEVFT